MAVRFGVSSTVKNRLPKYSNFWDGTAVYSPFSPTGSYDALATYTVPSGGVSSITFAGLPASGQYSHLQIRATIRCTTSAQYAQVFFQINDASSYYRHLILVDGVNNPPGAYGYTGQTYASLGYLAGNTALTNVFGVAVLDILDYANTSKYKTYRALGGADNNSQSSPDTYTYMVSGTYPSLDPINKIVFTPESGNFMQYTNISIYGVK